MSYLTCGTRKKRKKSNEKMRWKRWKFRPRDGRTLDWKNSFTFTCFGAISHVAERFHVRLGFQLVRFIGEIRYQFQSVTSTLLISHFAPFTNKLNADTCTL